MLSVTIEKCPSVKTLRAAALALALFGVLSALPEPATSQVGTPNESEPPAQAAPKAQAAPEATAPDSILALGSANQCCLYVADLLPVVRGIVDAGGVEWWNEQVPDWGGAFPRLDRVEVTGQLNQIQGFWPRSITLGATTSLAENLPNFYRLAAVFSLLAEAQTSDAPEFARELLADVVAHLDAIETGYVALALEFRDPGIAGLVSLGLISQAKTLGQLPGIEVVQKGNALEFSLTPQLVLEANGMLGPSDLISIAEWAEFKGTDALRDRMKRWRLPARIRVEGALMIADLGKPEDDGLGSTPKIEVVAGQHAVGRWNLGQLVKTAANLGQAWKEWSQTPSGRAVAANDEDNFFKDMITLEGQMRRYGQRGSMTLSLGQATRATVREIGLPPTPPISGAPAAIALPADAKWQWVDSIASFSDRILDEIQSVEARVARSDLRAVTSNDPESQARARNQVALFELFFRPTYNTLRAQMNGTFGSPWATAVDGWSEIARIDIDLPDGPVTVLAVPVPHFIAIAPILDPKRARSLIPATIRSMLETAEIPSDRARVAERDLGLGRTTFTLDLGVLTIVPAAGESLDPLHWFELDGLWVVSTSTSLSKQAIARVANPPKTSNATNVIARMTNPVPMLRDGFRRLGKTLKGNSVGFELMALLQLSDNVLALFQHFEMVIVQEGSTRETRFTVRLIKLALKSSRDSEPK